MRMKKYYLTICVIVLFAVGFSASNSKSAEVDFGSEQFVGKKEIVKSITSIDEMKKVIENTIWTHSKKDYLWYKLHFKDNQVEQYTALLSDSKKWDYLGCSPYTLKKGNYPDGAEYISAIFTFAEGNTSAEFNFNNCHLYLLGIDFGVFDNIDIEW